MKPLKRILSFILAITMLSTMFIYSEIGVKRANAHVALENHTMNIDTPEVEFIVPEVIYLKPGTKTFDLYYNAGQSFSATPSETGAISFSITSGEIATNISLMYAGGVSNVQLLTNQGSGSAFSTLVQSGTAISATQDNTITWSINYRIDGVNYYSYAYSYIYCPRTELVGTQGYKVYETSIGNEPKNHMFAFATGVHEVSGGNRTTVFNKTTDTVFASPIWAYFTNGEWDNDNVPSGTNSASTNINGTDSIETFPIGEGVYFYGRIRNDRTGCYFPAGSSSSYDAGAMPKGTLRLDSSRYSGQNFSVIPYFAAGVMQFNVDRADDAHRLIKITSENEGALTTPVKDIGTSSSQSSGHAVGQQLFHFSGSIPSSDTTYIVTSEYKMRRSSSSSVNIRYGYKIEIDVVNKSSLRSTLETWINKGLQGRYYKSNIWSAYSDALKNAAEVLGKPNSTQAQINDAKNNLNTFGNLLADASSRKVLNYTVSHKLPGNVGETININGTDFVVGSDGFVTITETGTFYAGARVHATANNYPGYTIDSGQATATSSKDTCTDWSHTFYYTLQRYNVYLDYDPEGLGHDGYCEGSDTTYKILSYTSVYGTLPSPTMDGWVFKGWYLEPSYTTRVYSTTTVTSTTEHTLYAKWTCNFGGGHGAQVDPFLIDNPTHLDNIDHTGNLASNQGKYFKQTTDFTYSINNVPVVEFKGHYDADNKTITIPSNVIISSSMYAGIFGKVSMGGSVKNLRVNASSTFRSVNGNAGLIGVLEGGTVENVQVAFDGVLTAKNAGALIGQVNSSGTTSMVRNSSVTADEQTAFIGSKIGGGLFTNNWTLIKSVPSDTSVDLGSNNVMYASNNGDVSLSGSGGAFTFTATPDAGWTARYVNSQGDVVNNTNAYTVPSTVDGMVFFAQFVKTVGFSASHGGAITPDGTKYLQNGDEVEVEATAETGYIFKEFILTGIPEQDFEINSLHSHRAVLTFGNTGGTIEASFEPISYTVVFKENGDDVYSMPEDIDATYDEFFSIPDIVPQRTGYTFRYWYTKPTDDGTGTSYGVGLQNLKNLTVVNGGQISLYAIWKEDSFSISFETDGGTYVPTLQLDFASYFTFPLTTKEGYTFGGWYETPDFEGVGNQIGTLGTVSGHKTYYAQWINNKYIVVFDANGGYNEPDDITAYYDVSFDIPTQIPTREGYTFLGWDDRNTAQSAKYVAGATEIINLSLGADPSAPNTPEVTLYAVWSVNSYIIVWNLVGGRIGGSTTNPQTTVHYGQNYILPASNPVKVGHTFLGWFTESGQDGTQVTEGTTVSVASNATHYAHWQANTYTIVFDKNDAQATNTMDDIQCTYGVSFSLPVCEFLKTGYRFEGWALTTTGEEVYFDGDQINTSLTVQNNATITLFAKWKAVSYILTYNANGGTGTMSFQYIPFDSTITLLENAFTKTGYTFIGWATSLVDAQDGIVTYTNKASYTMRKTGETLYAVWDSNPYNVTFYGNGNDGDSHMGVQSIGYGETVRLNLNTYTKKGYFFKGWSIYEQSTTVAYMNGSYITMDKPGISLWAQWMPVSYTIEYSLNTSDPSATNYPSSQMAFYDSPVILSSTVPMRTGYDFSGWALYSTASVKDFDVSQEVINLSSTNNATVTLYAVWSPKSYDITWLLRGGNINGSTSAVNNTVNFYGNYILPDDNPVRTGHDFEGWYTGTTTASTRITSSSVHTSTFSKIFYAVWSPITYNVVYNKNSSEAVGTMEKTTHAYDEMGSRLAANAFTRQGYEFLGWALTPDGEPIYSDEGYISNLTTIPNADVNLYAIWEPMNSTKFTVKYLGEDAQQTGYTQELLSIEYTNGVTSETIYASDYVRSDFDGFTWNGIDTSTVVGGDGTSVLEIYYSRNFYNVTFRGNGGKTSNNQTVRTQSMKYGVETELISNGFFRTGYSFLHWNTNLDDSGAVYQDNELFTIGTQNVTLYAIWSVYESSYTVEHYYQEFDGTYPEEPTFTDYISSDANITVEAQPHTDIGFTVDLQAPGTVSQGIVAPDNSLVLKLYYTRDSYDVVFDPGEGNGTPYTQTFQFGEEKELTAVSESFEKPGYIFSGWSVTESGAVSYIDSGWFKMNTDGATLYAVWTVNYYTISFNSNGGTPVSPITQAYNTPLTQPEPPTKSGYLFRAWMYEGADYEFIVMPDYNITLIADWIASSYQVIYDANGATFGNAPQATQGEYRESVILSSGQGLILDNSADEQYFRCVGWNTQPDGSGTTYYANEPFVMKSSDTTLYALWGANYYEVNQYEEIANGELLPASAVKDTDYAENGMHSYLSPTGNGYYPRENYTENSIGLLEDSLVPVTISSNLYRRANEQAVVDGYKNAIVAALTSLELKEIDFDAEYECWYYTGEPYPPCNGYHSFNGLIADTNEMIQSGYYDEESLYYILIMIDEAYMVINESMKIPHQVYVGDFVNNIAMAYHSAVILPADFSEFKSVWQNEVPWDNIDKYTQQSVDEMVNYYNNKASEEGSLTKFDQYIVDNYTTTLRGMIAELELLLADYTQLYEQLALIPPGYNVGDVVTWDDINVNYLRDNYTTNTIDVLENAVKSIDWELDITNQSMVDGVENSYVSIIAAAINQLEVKDVVYTVNHYLQDVDGLDYTLQDTEVLGGETNMTVEAVPKTYPGFVFDEANSTVSGVVAQDSSLVLDLYYTRGSYTITFVSNGGSPIAPLTAPFGQTITEPDAPTKNGYDFEGWYTDIKLTLPYTFDTMGTSDISLYAKWVPKVYKMTFNNNDGTQNVFTVTNFSAGQMTSAPTNNPTRAGYTFLYWSESANGSAGQYSFAEMPSEDVNLYAIWNANSNTPYTVKHCLESLDGSFECVESNSLSGVTDSVATAVSKEFAGFTYSASNSVTSGVIIADGSLELSLCYTRNSYTVTYKCYGDSTQDFETQTYKYEQQMTPPVNRPTDPEYYFGGWAQTAGSFEQYSFDTMPAENITLYAIWNESAGGEYTVYHWLENLDGTYTCEFSEDLTGEIGSTAVLQPNEYEGFTYSTQLSDAPSTLPPGESLEFNLYYTRNDHTIDFMLNDGTTGVLATDSFKYGEQTSATSETPTRAGYVFAYWSAHEDASSGEYSFGEMPDESITLYAVWSPATDTPYTVRHYIEKLDGGYKLFETQSLEGTTEAQATAQPNEYDGFTYAQQLSTTTGVIVGDGSLELTVYYTRNSYSMTYMLNDGTANAYQSQTYLYEEQTQSVAENPTRAGYDFLFWSEDTDATSGQFVFDTMPNEDITLYAVWEARTDTPYTVKHYLENVDGTFECVETENLTGTTGTDATAQPKDYSNFTYNPDLGIRTGRIVGDGTLELSVYYIRKSYLITFMLNDGSEDSYETLSFKYQESTAAPSLSPEREGYDFTIWSADAQGAGGEYIFGDMPAGNITLYAIWQARTDTPYTVKHYLENLDGSFECVDTQSLEGETDTEVFALPNEGYTGFSYSTDIGVATGIVLGNGSLVLELYYTRNSYTITYMLNDSSADVFEVQDYTYEMQTSAPQDLPTREGYDFLLWSDRADGGNGEYAFGEMPPNNIVLYAQWQARNDTPYTVKHYIEGFDGEYEWVQTQTFEGTTDTEITAIPNEYPGFSYSNDLGIPSGKIYGDGSLELSMYYTRNTYTIEFMFNDTTLTVYETIGYKYETQTYAPDNNPTRAGYDFLFWSASESGNDSEYSFEAMPANDIRLYAIWQARNDTPYTVKHYLEGLDGEYEQIETNSFTGTTDTTVTAELNEYQGFTFTPLMGVRTGKVLGDGTLELSVYYSRNTYTVSYMYNDGTDTVFTTQTYDYEQLINPPTASPQTAGYDFLLWSGDESGSGGEYSFGTMPASDIMIYAIWEARDDTHYSVEYYIEGLDGEFENVKVEGFTGTTGERVDAEIKEYTGFSFASASSLKSGEVLPNGSLVLKMYYLRNSYTITYFVDSQLYDTQTFKYEESITLLEEPTRAGYTFGGWSQTPEAMPSNDLTVSGQFIFSGTEYIIAQEGSTTVIDRERNYIYGLDFGIDFDEFENEFVDTNPTIHLQYDYYGLFFGTGTRVMVVDNETDEIIETYTIIIIGDVDGDGLASSSDATIVSSVVALLEDDLPEEFMIAANTDSFSGITTSDITTLLSGISKLFEINQAPEMNF